YYYHDFNFENFSKDMIAGVRQATGNTGRPSADTTYQQMINAMPRFGLSAERIGSSSGNTLLLTIQKAVVSGKPVIVLVHGNDLGRGEAYGDHFVVVTGFTPEGDVVVNDPDQRNENQLANVRKDNPRWVNGGKLTIARSTFISALTDADGGPSGLVVGSAS
ncbi:MAG TPA: C39 family peptidase, partial [Candidatus Saccharimonadales bacterium]|nr:C39 family peptidase [Candidatus Saccharimonadales bacterium]